MNFSGMKNFNLSKSVLSLFCLIKRQLESSLSDLKWPLILRHQEHLLLVVTKWTFERVKINFYLLSKSAINRAAEKLVATEL